MLRRCYLLLPLVYACGSVVNAPAAVVLGRTDATYDETYAFVSDGYSTNYDYHGDAGSTTALATLPGYSIKAINSQVGGDPANLSAGFELSRPAGNAGVSDADVGIPFVVDVDSYYSASGSFMVSAGKAELESALFDYTTGAFLYNSYQTSGGPGGSFMLGQAGSDFDSYFRGSLTGTLLAGHSYNWYAVIFTSHLTASDPVTIGEGNVTLAISAVPEVSVCSAAVWCLLATVHLGARRRFTASPPGATANSLAVLLLPDPCGGKLLNRLKLQGEGDKASTAGQASSGTR